MLRVVIAALKLTSQLPDIDADLAGVDYGALVLARRGLHMKLAVGDFDSVQEGDLALIRKYADEVIVLNPVKDDTDSEAALHALRERGYDEIIFTGALGGRIDHEYVNLKLAMKYPGIVTLYDPHNRVHAYGEGTWRFAKEEYRYFSVFTSSEAVISLKGFKYPLEDRRITPDDIYTVSNEITGAEGILEVKEGKVLVIQSSDSF